MSFPRYPKYKSSGVEWLEEVPAHWSVRRLKQITRLITQRAESRTRPIALEHIKSGTGQLVDSVTDFQGEGTAFATGDLLFGKLRPYLAKAWLADSAGEAVGDFHVLRPSSSLAGRYLLYSVLNRDFIDLVDASTYGSKMPRASWEFMGCIGLSVPPIHEQHSIAAFLERETSMIDALIEEQERLIELLAEKRQAIISHAVTKGLNPSAPMKPSGIEWLGHVPTHWDVVGLTKYVDSIVDYRGRTPMKVDEGVFLVTARNIRNGRIDYDASVEFIAESEYEPIMRRGKPEIGDVLFTTEAPLGQIANVDRIDIALAQRVIKLRGRTNVLDNYFLKYWMMSSFSQAEMIRLATGSTALGIKGSKVVQLRLCLPPLGEQRMITQTLDQQLIATDFLVAQADQATILLRERRSALISAAVTGQIDVRTAVLEPTA